MAVAHQIPAAAPVRQPVGIHIPLRVLVGLLMWRGVDWAVRPAQPRRFRHVASSERPTAQRYLSASGDYLLGEPQSLFVHAGRLPPVFAPRPWPTVAPSRSAGCRHHTDPAVRLRRTGLVCRTFPPMADQQPAHTGVAQQRRWGHLDSGCALDGGAGVEVGVMDAPTLLSNHAKSCLKLIEIGLTANG
jgi:hypothetical protein